VTTEERVRARAGAQGGLITAAQCRDVGLTKAALRARLRNGEWRRLCRGTYLVDAFLHEETESLRLRAALLALGPESVAVLDTAARIHGIDGVPWPPSACHVSRPRDSPRKHRPVIRVHHLTLPPEHVTTVDGVSVTTPVRTLVDLLCQLDRAHAVSVADAALRLGLASDGVESLLRQRRNRSGLGWLSLANGLAESPLETRVRLAALDGGVPPDELQYPIHDERGVLLGIADMVWKKQRVIAEADGAGPHSEPQALFRDRRRQNDLANAGWTVLRFTWADTLRRGYVAATVRRALVSGWDHATPRVAGPNR
jgi:Protein of unknown function (DUF559)/Transcriptional regulator, AbiEi antitoxin